MWKEVPRTQKKKVLSSHLVESSRPSLTSVSLLEFSQRFNSDMILEAAIGVCIHEWSKIHYINKGVIKQSLIGSPR